MDFNSSIQQFTILVNEFTQHKDFTEQGNKIFKQKQKQLVDFSKNFNSLGVSLVVLENSEDSTAVYFASQFIKDKLKFQFQQLKPDVVAFTHTNIINIIRTKKNVSKIVTSNLALSLAFLYIHCYDKLGSVLDFFKNTFITNTTEVSGNLYYQYLFRYLDGIVCEVDSRRLVIDEMKRVQVIKSLKSQQTEILTTLHTTYLALSSPSSTIKLSTSDLENILYSFSQWLRIQQPPLQVITEIHNHSVLTLALSALEDMQLSQAATQCLLATIQIAKNPQVGAKFYDFIGQNINGLIKGVNRKITDEQFDEAENYIRVMCQYGRRAGKKLIDQANQQTFAFLQRMIKYTQDPILQVFRELSDFWESIMYFIKNRSPSSPILQKQADIIAGKIYVTFCNRIAYTPTQIHELDQLTQRQLQKLFQNIEDVRERRQSATFVFQSVGSYFGVERFITQVYKLILECDRNNSSWCGIIQSYLYSLREITKSCVRPTESLCSLLIFYENIEQKHKILIKTMLKLQSSLLEMQQKNQQFVLKLLNHAVVMLDDKLIGSKAADNFEKCCELNSGILINHIESIYQLLRRYPDRQEILSGLTHLLKKYPAMLQAHLPQILKHPLQKLKSSKSKKQKRNQFNKLFTIIECIPKESSNSSVQLGSLVQKLLQDMWPILSQTIKQPQNLQSDQDRLVERAIKFLKLVMRSIPQQFIKYLKDVFMVVGEAYKKYPINSYVYIFEVAFTVYHKSNQPELIAYLQSLYQQYCKVTYLHLNSEAALSNYQHLVDDFIGLNKRIVTFHTRMFLESGQAKFILQFSIHCLRSGLPRITSSASQLFEIIFMIYWSAYSRQQYKNGDRGEVVEFDNKNVQLYQELKAFILPIVTNLLKQMFKFLETGPVQTARNNILDCFQAIALAFPNQSASLWAEPLSQLEQDIITLSQKQRFKQSLLKLGSNNHLQFINAEQVIKKLLFTMSSRFLYRQSRAEGLTNS